MALRIIKHQKKKKRASLWSSLLKLTSLTTADKDDAETILWSTDANLTVHPAECSHKGDECSTVLLMDRFGDVKLVELLPNGVPGNNTLWHTDTNSMVLAQRAEVLAQQTKMLAAEQSAQLLRDLAKDTNVCPGSNLFFVHIPKNGGGTVEQSICPMKDRYTTKTRVQKELGFNKVNFLASHLLLDEQTRFSPNGLKDSITFAMMRNPYDRFVSEANYRKGRKSLQEQVEICKNATTQTNHDIFAHCRPQTDFVGVNGDKVDYLFLMFDGVERFLQKHGYKLANISKYSHVSEKRWVAADLTKGQREWIEATYADDFNLLRDKFDYIATVENGNMRSTA